MNLYDLVDPDEINWLMANGYLREQIHPTEPLVIFNYTDRAQTKPEIFRQYPALNHCRGLIWNADNGEIVARPFKKFWNRGQENAARIRPTDFVEVADKMDGSLGIAYRRPSDGFIAIATRGSFTSDQAIHATELLRDKYADWYPMPGETALFEIVYPDNRIVLDYGKLDDLILLGAVEIHSGAVSGAINASYDHRWYGPITPSIIAGKWQDVMKHLPLNRENKEGLVVRVVGGGVDRIGNMIKLKQEDYLILHRAIFGLSTRRIYEAILAGTVLDAILEPLPDEFHDWTRAVYTEIHNAFKKRYSNLQDQYLNTMSYAFNSGIAGVDDGGQLGGYYVEPAKRGALAKLFQEADDDAWAMFALLDGKDITKRIWKDLEPPAHQTPSTYEPTRSTLR